MEQLPDLPIHPPESESNVSIKKRLGHTRFLTPLPPTSPPRPAEETQAHRDLNHDLALLYRLALDMGKSGDSEELVGSVLDGLLEATPADVGAILKVKEGQELEVLDHRHRNPGTRMYDRVSEYVSHEVLESKQAILAEDVAGDRHLKNRESLSDIGATSLICAPVMYRDEVLALIHLYCTDASKALDQENLEFAMAVATHLGNAFHHLNRQSSLVSRQ
jgi:Nif-specific regulatory protein